MLVNAACILVVACDHAQAYGLVTARRRRDLRHTLVEWSSAPRSPLSVS